MGLARSVYPGDARSGRHLRIFDFDPDGAVAFRNQACATPEKPRRVDFRGGVFANPAGPGIAGLSGSADAIAISHAFLANDRMAAAAGRRGSRHTGIRADMRRRVSGGASVGGERAISAEGSAANRENSVGAAEGAAFYGDRGAGGASSGGDDFSRLPV